MAWVAWFKNRRLHSSFGYSTPAEHEADHCASQPVDQPSDGLV